MDSPRSLIDWFATLPLWVQGVSALASIVSFVPIALDGTVRVYRGGRWLMNVIAGLSRRTAMLRAERMTKRLHLAEKMRSDTPRLIVNVGIRVSFSITFILLAGVAFTLSIIDAYFERYFHEASGSVGTPSLSLACMVGLFLGSIYLITDMAFLMYSQAHVLSEIAKLLEKAGLGDEEIEIWLAERGIKARRRVAAAAKADCKGQ